MTTQSTIETNDILGRYAEFEGVPHVIRSVNKGWFTVTNPEGVESKVRKSAIEEALLPEDYEPAEDDESTGGMAKQLSKYRATYVTSIAPSGRKSLSKGDMVAKALEARELNELYGVVEDIFDLDLRDKYAKLNLGSQRMNLGNRIRAAFKNVDHAQHDAVVEWVNSHQDDAVVDTE